MKKQYIIISILFVFATAFTFIQSPNAYDEIRNSIIQNLCLYEIDSKNFDQRRTPDTSLLFSKPNNVDAYYTGKYTLRSLVGFGVTSPCYHIANAIDPIGGEYANSFFDTKFRDQFGVSFHAKRVKMAQNFEGEHATFLFYNPIAFKTAFQKLYVLPKNSFEKYTYQKIYDVSAKDYLRDVTKFFVYLMAKKTAFAQGSNQFLTNAKTKKYFNMYEESKRVLDKVFPTEASRKQFPNMTEELDAYSFASIIRRQCDGTLPTILACLKTVLKDYDPEALKLIKGTF